MRVVAIIQARLNSARFPKKILADLCGKPVLQHVIERAQKIHGVSEVAVATTPQDQRALLNGPIVMPSVRLLGEADESDVLGRFTLAARHLDVTADKQQCRADVIVRITADCPLLDPVVSSLVLARFLEEGADYCSNDVNESGYPDGLDTEVFTRALLDRAHAEATSPYDREHVTPWMKRAVGVKVTLVKKPGAIEVSRDKWSIDTPEDLARVAKVMEDELDAEDGGRFGRGC